MRIFGSEGTVFRRMAGRGRRGGGAVDVIPPDRPRRVRHSSPTLADRHVIDAEFEIVEKDAPLRRQPAAPNRQCRSGGPAATVRGAAAAETAGASSRMLFLLLLILLSAASFWIAGGHALASRGVGVGLSVAGIDTRIVQAGSFNVLVVTGRVENRTTEARPLPPVLVHVANDVVPARIHSSGEEIAAGAMLPFEARMRVAAGERPAVRVDFARPVPRLSAH